MNTDTNPITNLSTFDPFEDAKNADIVGGGSVGVGDKIHLRCQQRNGRKCITTVQGLSSDLELKKILRHFKKTFSCNGALVNDKELGDIMQLSGDQREGIKKFLVDSEISSAGDVVIHGV